MLTRVSSKAHSCSQLKYQWNWDFQTEAEDYSPQGLYSDTWKNVFLNSDRLQHRSFAELEHKVCILNSTEESKVLVKILLGLNTPLKCKTPGSFIKLNLSCFNFQPYPAMFNRKAHSPTLQ